MNPDKPMNPTLLSKPTNTLPPPALCRRPVMIVVVLAAVALAGAGWPVESAQAKGGAISRGLDKVAKLFQRGSQAGADDALTKAATRRADDAAEIASGAGGRIEGSAASRPMTGASREMAERVPEAAQALRTGGDELVELALRHGDDVLRIEARFPGLGREAARLFPDPQDLARLNRLSDDMLPDLLRLANRADNPQTARLLLDAVESHGPSVLRHLTPKVIAAGGLTTGMIIVATGTSKAIHEVGTGAGEALSGSAGFGDKVGGALNLGVLVISVAIGLCLVLVAARLVPKRARAAGRGAAESNGNGDESKAQPRHRETACSSAATKSSEPLIY